MLQESFEALRLSTAEEVLNTYTVSCPNCKRKIHAENIVWRNEKPEAVKVFCPHCGSRALKALTAANRKSQIVASEITPGHSYPENVLLRTDRRPPVKYQHELFTGRNLRNLALLKDSIGRVERADVREALEYVFTAMLYSCSNMQMHSDKEPTSSRGWTAFRYYVPPAHKEKNVWVAFETRYKAFLKMKKCLNSFLAHVRVTDDLFTFFNDSFDVLVRTLDVDDVETAIWSNAAHVFLDPPYNPDIEYFAFSDFWAAWLDIRFDWDREWVAFDKDRFRSTAQRIRRDTTSDCGVTIAIPARYKHGRDSVEVLQEAGFGVINEECSGPFGYSNTLKRGHFGKRSSDDYYVTLSSSRDNDSSRDVSAATWLPGGKSDDESCSEAIDDYLRIASHLLLVREERREFDKVRALALTIAPKHLQNHFTITPSEAKSIVTDEEDNRRTFNAFCLALLSQVLDRDDWTLDKISREHVSSKFGLELSGRRKRSSKQKGEPIVAKAVYGERNISICIPGGKLESLRSTCENIRRSAKKNRMEVALAILGSKKQMEDLRDPRRGGQLPGLLLATIDELMTAAVNTSAGSCSICSTPPEEGLEKPRSESTVSVLDAKVLENMPVGDGNMSSISPHFRISFEASHVRAVRPGQFLMVSTSPRRELKIGSQIESLAELKEKPDMLRSRAFLKRPFSIHRTYYPGFEEGYLSQLSLPKSLTGVAHTVYPDRFDIFYKVLPHGVGTNEMSRLKKNDVVQVVGPLGKGLDVPGLRKKGFDEIHVVGGGVGMAPLILFVQHLRFHSFNVKAFMGISSIEAFRASARTDIEENDLEDSFSEDVGSGPIYIQELLDAGLAKEDIYLSYDSDSGDAVADILPRQNLYHGPVSNQYRKYLEGHIHNKSEAKSVLAISCGPDAMMKAVYDVADNSGVSIKVLKERRMACGLGLCLSCVCKKADEKQHFKVCTDGPLFDAGDLSWK
jgi:dihydroorotate dehydrogenase electron transfer subunit